MECERVQEGRTTLIVPVQDPSHPFPPASAHVFYNRRMEINRDATILFLAHARPDAYLDLMGATGARGIRVGNELGIAVTINDRDPLAAALIAQNAEENGVSVEILCEDANTLMSRRKFDAIDIDPFGTPAPFIDAACRSARRYLFVTATDTAPLCGAHLRAGIRRYGAVPRNTEYHAEVGLRILLGFIAREMVKYDRGMLPLFSFSYEHFIRLHLAVKDGVKTADATVSHMGYILQCPSCPHHNDAVGLLPAPETCPVCCAPLIPIGPLWTGPINEPDALEDMLHILPAYPLGAATPLHKLLLTCREELPVAGFYDYHVLAKRLRVSPPKIGDLVTALRMAGFPATRTHFSGTGIKTTAPLPLIDAALCKNPPPE
ncbi:MAG: tRNA (guanine(10)-N(2))-dimethyltransferase [Methanomicrobiales archaeon]|nr:tRNA (guanine(10)-N(2))-dimethyltransferase [Methanomicrobiales archaeon]